MQSIIDGWDDFSAGDRRELVASILERIEVRSDGSLELIALRPIEFPDR